ncbi:Transcription factor MYB124 [Arabidopsis thaliana]|jgi:myb proto-oncogene protein|uniref:Transcription factor MYB124 n=4 Tax=Arabidopsis TaxID=3701 RepID=MY124_ARATH|nr:Duplicated homeodomain-like superfamily protein [Arabidopsis thaliana]NP_563948.1 Duplicated homeodomain-like superfamily protein [Arabidopsis thaliana]Q94FL6.1 RecName: Full=Transcription factor MYB124; AltName: Full=Myb-related protein 124; Short=AtMYB124; AltName: Full=Protein FOUR LIPS [Arabidopsis thaliana]KAG7597008.1 Homeobox-like domain superfamily [Arabidopsis suecica]KAG7646282.1 Homeobox-like domain superfamily [Arabidopsis thaliana x Arabidopsis arenosa]AAK54745.2 putative trans|eukprot:NP_001077534.1 Duplicated homeodomain-like superfamily protein [Arabidopsis thaliana]
MEDTKKKKKKNINNNQDSKKKERHIVTWSQEEDVILREQITLHGTENWAIIASKFKDKSTRQCRRRWYTYLNSDFKRGGWSPEEDMLLCEAQRVFGNRWTEIAKVVSGRTDNAVKNRFTTLCKKRAKHEAMTKDSNSNTKRMLFLDGISTPRKSENETPIAKKLKRSHILDLTEISNYGRAEACVNQQIRSPFSVLARNATGIDSLEEQNQTSNVNESDGEGMFLKKDDPKVTALMQQAELLSSLAQKVNADNTEQSMENAWKVLQDFLNKGKENDLFRYGIPDIDFKIEEFKDLIEDLRSGYEDNQLSWRQPDLHDSPASSEYSSGSTIMVDQSGDKTQPFSADTQTEHKQVGEELLVPKNPDENMPISGEEKFSSPIQVTPLFRSLADGIPSPQFSESERSFLLKTLGIESSSPCPSANPSKPPPCKRVLLHSL